MSTRVSRIRLTLDGVLLVLSFFLLSSRPMGYEMPFW